MFTAQERSQMVIKMAGRASTIHRYTLARVRWLCQWVICTTASVLLVCNMDRAIARSYKRGAVVEAPSQWRRRDFTHVQHG